MTKDLIIIILGVWVALVPFLGFPNDWDIAIFVFSGLAIVVLTLLLRRELTHLLTDDRHGFSRRGDSFIESGIHSANKEKVTSSMRGRNIVVNHNEETSDTEGDKTENS